MTFRSLMHTHCWELFKHCQIMHNKQLDVTSPVGWKIIVFPSCSPSKKLFPNFEFLLLISKHPNSHFYSRNLTLYSTLCVCVWICVSPIFWTVNGTSTEARLALGCSSLTPPWFLLLVKSNMTGLGKRIYLKCTLTGSLMPIQAVPRLFWEC